MTQTNSLSTEQEAPKWGGVKAVYFLYIASFFVGFTGLIGVIVAYVFKGENAISDSHFRWQIRTFWISILFVIVVVVTSFIGLGLIFGALFVLWYLIRVIKGIKAAFDKKPIQNPGSWLV